MCLQFSPGELLGTDPAVILSGRNPSPGRGKLLAAPPDDPEQHRFVGAELKKKTRNLCFLLGRLSCKKSSCKKCILINSNSGPQLT